MGRYAEAREEGQQASLRFSELTAKSAFAIKRDQQQCPQEMRSQHLRVANLGHLDDSLGLGLDTLQETRLGELESGAGSLQLVVGSGLGADLDELGEVTLVGPELLALIMDDARADIVEEARVVGHDHGGDVGEVG